MAGLVASALSKLSLTARATNKCIWMNTPITYARSLHTTPLTHIKLTDVCCSAILKKRKRADPATDKMKEERRRKRLSKALRKMEKKQRQPKPLLEIEIPAVLFQEAATRTRPVSVSEQVEEERHYFMKDWGSFAKNRHRNEIFELDTKLIAQQKALDELRMESLDLYLEACKFDPQLLPFTAMGPTHTPPIKDYLQDGEYKDVSREYKVIYEDTEAFLRKLVSKVRSRKKKKALEEDD